LKHAEWRIRLSSLATTHDHFKALEETGGYALTHVGALERADGKTFKGDAANGVLQAMRFFLSFAKGALCTPVCPVGFDGTVTRVWEQWSSPDGPWASQISWFDPHTSQQMEDLFAGFMRRWQNSEWQSALREVLYWYFNANDSYRGIDAGIILMQTALERLSFEYAVRDRRLIEATGFKDLRASDAFRLLLSSLDIPIEIPAELHSLTALSKKLNWVDAPHALTEVRNALVHPDHKRRSQVSSAYLDAWQLGLWFLELAILRVCAYEGTYSNRLQPHYVGEVQSVPWTPRSTIAVTNPMEVK